jgi:hypothetical protein
MKHMKQYIFLALIAVSAVLGSVGVSKVHALSCLPVEMYLKDVVGKDDVMIFVATPKDRIEGIGYTAEVLDVREAKQGYVEKEVFVYHQKDETWGYLCNNGPKEKGTESFYVVTRSTSGKYDVAQRLDLNDPIVKTIEKDLKDAEILGEVVELPKIDRMNQIMTTISDLFKEIGILLKEYVYWNG